MIANSKSYSVARDDIGTVTVTIPFRTGLWRKFWLTCYAAMMLAGSPVWVGSALAYLPGCIVDGSVAPLIGLALAGWALLWCGITGTAIAFSAWNLVGVEVVSIVDKRFRIEHRAFLLRWTNECSLSDSTAIRTCDPAEAMITSRWPPWVSGYQLFSTFGWLGGRVLLDNGTERLCFGKTLDEVEARELVSVLTRAVQYSCTPHRNLHTQID